MERRKFIKSCCYATIAIPVLGTVLQSCGTLYYASVTSDSKKITIAKSEFIQKKKDKTSNRKFVLLKIEKLDFPICVYKISGEEYVASLLMCTHSNCELNVGGGIYTCPCHGSEFTTAGAVLEGPANKNLKTFKTTTDNENIYVYLS